MQAAPLTPQISLTQLTEGQSEFARLYAAHGQPGFAPDIKLSWPELYDTVQNKGGIAETQEIVLRLIHRFENMNWFMTMECCRLDMTSGKIIEHGNRFDLNNNGISPSSFTGDFDQAYFDAVTCDGQPTDPQLFVNSITLPWYQQLVEMLCQNNLPNNDDSIFLKLSSCTYDYSASPKLSLVQWPHIILFFMSATDHGDYVDDADYTEMFTNKAGDYTSLCPPNNNHYEWPANLPRVNTCMQQTK